MSSEQPKDSFDEYLEWASARVNVLPEWKRNLLGSPVLLKEQQPMKTHEPTYTIDEIQRFNETVEAKLKADEWGNGEKDKALCVYNAIIDQLFSELREARAEREWMPISIIPKDGQQAIMYDPDQSFEYQLYRDYYIGPENDPETHNEMWAIITCGGFSPTHYLPITLPQPPSSPERLTNEETSA